MQPDPPLHSGSARSDRAPTGTSLTIRDVSALLGVPAPTIRSWERRHALPVGSRDEHGHRRYDDDDVEVLRRMRDQRALGVRVGEAATTATAPPPPTLCEHFLAADEALDAAELKAVLDLSVDAHGLPVTLDEVLLPSMREIGERWAHEGSDIVHEHLSTTTVLAWLSVRAAQAPPPLDRRPIVLTCGPQDQHTISLEAFGVLLRQERFECLDLGAQTPAVSLRLAVEQSSARAVVLVSQLPSNRAAAVSALHAVRHSGAALFYAGAAFRSPAYREAVPGHYLGDNLASAATHVAALLRPSSSGRDKAV